MQKLFLLITCGFVVIIAAAQSFPLSRKVYSTELDSEFKEEGLIKLGLDPSQEIMAADIFIDGYSFTLAVNDVNKNGRFDDVGIDQVSLGHFKNDSLSFVKSVSSSSIQPIMSVPINGVLHNISFKEQTVVLQKVVRGGRIGIALQILEYFPEKVFDFRDASTGNRLVYDTDKYNLAVFWGHWCAGCLTSFDELKNQKGVNLIPLAYNSSVVDIAAFRKRKGLETLPFYIIGKRGVEYFGVSKFPFYILFDTNKKLVGRFDSAQEVMRFFER